MKLLIPLLSITVRWVAEFLTRVTEISFILYKKNNGLQGNSCILVVIDIALGLQKLGLILESKVVQKLSLEKNVFKVVIL